MFEYRRGSFPLQGLGLALFVACSSTTTETPNTDGGLAGTGGGAGSSAGDSAVNANGPVVGAFIAELFTATATDPARTATSGKVFDGPSPSPVAWDLLEEAGGCRLLKPRAPFCDPPCTGGKVCEDGNQCAGYPASQNLGPVRVTGFASDFTLEAIANAYEAPIDLVLPFPPATEGADVKIGVTQGPFGAFGVASKAIAPLSSPTAKIAIETGKPLALTWTAGKGDVARIEVKVDISHHGGTKGKIECDVPDNGSLEIGASLVTKLIDLGVAGFPTVAITRASTGSTPIAPGKVLFRVIAGVTRDLEVAGFQSCNDKIECPTGKLCLPSFVCEH